MVVNTFWTSVLSIFCLVMVVLSIVRGYKDGFVLKALELISLFLSIPIAWWLANLLSEKIKLVSNGIQTNTVLDSMINGMVNKVVLFIIMFIILRIVIMLCRPLFRKCNRIPLIGLANRLTGLVLGTLQSFLVLVIISLLISTPLFTNGEEVLEKTNLIYVWRLTNNVVSSNDMNLLNTIQKWEDSEQELVDEDYQNIKEWMQKQQFTAQEQEDIIALMQSRNKVENDE